MSNNPPTLLPMLSKLQLWMRLDSKDQEAVLGLPYSTRRLGTGQYQYIVRDGEKPTHSCLLLRGFAYRHKVTGEGGRQIMSIHMQGDVVDLQNSLLPRSDHNV